MTKNKQNHFYSWLSGFIDGEGYFGLLPNNKGKFYMAQVCVKLRSDDKKILEKIKEVTGAGKVYSSMQSQNYTTKKGDIHTQVKWQVGSTPDCMKLVNIFDEYPLLGKKSEVYKLWRKAVIEMTKNGNGKSKQLDDIYTKLIEIKKYK